MVGPRRRFAVGPLVAGIVLAAVLYTLVGFLLIARYRSINEYMFPSILFTAVLSLPMLHYFGLWDTWAALSPSLHGAPRAAGGGLPAASVVAVAYGLLYAAAWTGLLLLAARRTFDRFIVARREGADAVDRGPAGVRPVHGRARGRGLMPTAAAVVRALGPIDARSVARDSMLRWLVATPIAYALAFRWGSPSSAPGSTSDTRSTSRRTTRLWPASSC